MTCTTWNLFSSSSDLLSICTLYIAWHYTKLRDLLFTLPDFVHYETYFVYIAWLCTLRLALYITRLTLYSTRPTLYITRLCLLRNILLCTLPDFVYYGIRFIFCLALYITIFTLYITRFTLYITRLRLLQTYFGSIKYRGSSAFFSVYYDTYFGSIKYRRSSAFFFCSR
jgi:hypothetical protein